MSGAFTTPVMATKSWIVYKTDGLSAYGWEDRILQPSGALTSILAEEHDYSGVMPKVGDRVREYTNLSAPGHGITHGKDGDWVISQVDVFDSPTSSFHVVVCTCQFQPIESEWEVIHRGKPINEAELANTAN